MSSAHDPQGVLKQTFIARKLGLAAVLMLMMASVARCWPPGNRVPPMGWEPWNFDHCGSRYKWDEEYYKKLADFFVTSGLRNLGYNYLTIECHDHYRDKKGQIQPSLRTFPRGFRVVTDYLHTRGLKVRTYTDAGKGKCGSTFEGAGSLGRYEDDVKQWVKFGFDGVKIDWCGGNSLHLDPKTQYLQFAEAMKKSGHPFCIEICSWGKGNPWKWGRKAGTFWRTSGDIDIWNRHSTIGGNWDALMRNLDANRHPSTKYVGPWKGWNYPDMLEVGVPGGLNETEERTQFSMWAIMAAPLFLGDDVFNMPRYARAIIMNKEVIAIDQDPLGIQGDVVKESENGKLQVWAKQLKSGSKAVALLNRDATPRQMTVNWNDLGISGKWQVRDLWQHRDQGVFADQYSAHVPSHGAALLKISPQPRH
ncbi:MAG TPA: glycoside hydrolase family 27 protein [Terriglobia bacterium]|nr:glycoside hydrolase family 27 protein [Terriglobia bacterium]